MCKGCHIRERLLKRTHERLEAAFRELERAYDAVRAVAIDTAGPTTPLEKSMSFSNTPAPKPPRRRKRGEQLQLFEAA